MKLFLLFLAVFASKRDEHMQNKEEQGEHEIAMVKIEEDENVKKRHSSQFIGVSWSKSNLKWQVRRWSKIEGKMIHNGCFNVDEETKAAHASDTLARAFIEKGEEDHKLNFPDDRTEVWAEEKETSSKFCGVTWNKKNSKWQVRRWSKIQGKKVCNGYFNVDEEIKAAHASDTLARALIVNGEKSYRLNFVNDEIEVWAEERETSSKYFGVSWSKRNSNWQVQRWSKIQCKHINNGCFHADEEIKAAHASDTLARTLIANSEYHKLNFVNDETDVWPKRNIKRKRNDNLKPQNN